MLFYTTLFIWLLSHCDAVYPDGIYTGLIADPYLFFNCTFQKPYPHPYDADVDMSITCDKTKPPSRALVGVEEFPGTHGMNYTVNGEEDDRELMEMMIDQLNTDCPGRNFTYGDFSNFYQEVPGLAYSTYGDGYKIMLEKT
ncbi:hypothetical protein FOL47_002985 [Perkinsus chesapeaki]|uniref:Chitin synthase, class 2 n=1 Tax=Perkinsus chesapeaki TaxID=330153 RepID=A0A7J6MA97_PERCH|nr:hypothetical protein FOL47_002985 [Perkinsus chesapeaki]